MNAEPLAKTAPTRMTPAEEPAVPDVLPILPVRNTVLFPGTVMPLNINRPTSLKLLEESLPKTKVIGIVTQRVPQRDEPEFGDLYTTGVAVSVLKLLRQQDNSVVVIAQPFTRIVLKKVVQAHPYLRAQVERLPSPAPPTTNKQWEAAVNNLRETAAKLVELTPDTPEELRAVIMNIDEPDALADFVASTLRLDVPHRQEILEELDVVNRVRKVQERVSSQLEIAQIQQKLQQAVSSQFTDLQRRAYLREQIKAIQKELGEGEQGVEEQVDQLRNRLEEAKLPPQAMEAAERELKRLWHVPPASAEFSVIVSYVETLAELPWSKMTRDHLDLHRAQRILNRDHFDLEKVKRRLIEYLAVRKLNPQGRGAILCFLGPPGVGKTSLGQSIADALGRKFSRLSLGGMRDEAEIRGHRRTYIGSMPGRLIQELRRLGSRNPIIMLDEIDKLGTDFRGDPASALLEVLDARQNETFVDHYLDVPFDLSQIIFIATANYMDPVPPALRDRMEVLEIPGYTDREKLEIARRYLVKRQLQENGLKPRQCRWTVPALAKIIEDHTRESGVRELERQISAVCRAVAARVAQGKEQREIVTRDTVTEILGPARFVREARMKSTRPGMVTGLAYTPFGGEVLHIEATRYPGKGNVTLTGNIGEVMKESVQAAFSLVRSRAAELGIPSEAFKDTDIHVHVPSGAVPKDGPSAGVAMFTALASLFTSKPVRPSVAMTGEITLRGLVLSVGGLKEKSLAALRAGISTVMAPRLNEKDLPEIPAEVKSHLRFIFADTVDEVLEAALVKQHDRGRALHPHVKPRVSANGHLRHKPLVHAGHP